MKSKEEKKTKKKKNPVIRFIVAILIIALAGGASYVGSKSFFTYKFKKEKEAAAKKEAEELAASIKDTYITCIRVGNFVALRCLDTKNTKMTIVCMRPESDLFTYDSDGNGEKMKKVVNNIQNAYGITVDGYEDFDQEAFVTLINEGSSFSADLPYKVTFRDMNSMRVHIQTGVDTLNGNQSWGVLSGTGEYGKDADETISTSAQQAFIEGAESFIAGYANTIFTNTDNDKLAKYVKTIYKNASSNKEYSDISNYVQYASKLTPDDIYVTELEGTEKNDTTFEVDIDKAKDMLSDICDGKTAGTCITKLAPSSDSSDDSSDE